MLLAPEVIALINAAIAFCFVAISGLIFVGLWKERQAGFNPLGVATALIFFTCASGHGVHAGHYLLSTGMYVQSDHLWNQAVADSLTLIPAIYYLALRRRYGLVIRGPHALLDFARRLDLAEALRSIGEDIAAQTDLDDVLRRVTRHARSLLGADYAAVVTTDASGKLCCQSMGIHNGWAEHEWRAAVFMDSTGAAGSLLRARQPVRIRNLHMLPTAARDEYAIHIAQGARAILAVPIARGTDVVGSLVVGYRSARALTSLDQSKMAALASQAAVAVENARLIDGLREAVHARDEFLSVAAHELKTPITSLRGFTQLMAKHLDKGGDQRDDQFRRGLQVVDQQSQKLSTLVAQLLDISRVESGQLSLERREVDIGDLAQAVVNSTQITSSRHSFVLHVEALVLAVVDPLRIEQVIRNLVDNATKYSPHGGDINLDVWKPTPDTICLAVRDHGVGIAEEQRAHIFDRFYRGHTGDHASGMGLGLYISRLIVELHGGSIEVESPPDGGSRFVVILPVRTGTADQSTTRDVAWDKH
ncbi:MAG: GAF domain-containing protein [Chloroflexota bacterium]|nr:MAG: GAF domain-containing protein [Chloroflexota bacterium]